MTDYSERQQIIFEKYSSTYGEKKARKFCDFIDSRYQKLNKHYLPHKVMWRCFDMDNKVRRHNQFQTYGCVGRGGTGKSTLMKNVLHFHDPTFSQKRIATTMDQFVDVLFQVLDEPDGGKYKAIMIDEPSKEEHSASKKWRITEDVLGQIRQANLFMGVCATELSNLKRSVYSLITGLFAFRKYYIYDYYDEQKTEGIIGLIRKEYDKTKTYECLSKIHILKKRLIKNVGSYNSTPLDYQQDEYDLEKKRAFMNKLRKLHEMKHGRGSTPHVIDKIDEIILKKRRNKITFREISKDLMMPVQTIHDRLKRIENQGTKIIWG